MSNSAPCHKDFPWAIHDIWPFIGSEKRTVLKNHCADYTWLYTVYVCCVQRRRATCHSFIYVGFTFIPTETEQEKAPLCRNDVHINSNIQKMFAGVNVNKNAFNDMSQNPWATLLLLRFATIKGLHIVSSCNVKMKWWKLHILYSVEWAMRQKTMWWNEKKTIMLLRWRVWIPYYIFSDCLENE